MHIVAVVRNMTGICQVIICIKLGVRRPVFEDRRCSPFLLANNFRMLSSPFRCDESRCKRTVWSAAERMLNKDRMMPQYHDVRTDQGELLPFGKILGHDPVEVRTPASRADFYVSASPRIIHIDNIDYHVTSHPSTNSPQYQRSLIRSTYCLSTSL